MSKLDALKASFDNFSSTFNGSNSSVNIDTSGIISDLDKIDNSLHDSLFTSNNPFSSDVLKNGLESGTDSYATTVTNSFDGFVQNNIFSFSNQVQDIPTVSFDLLGQTFVLFDSSFLSSLPISDIKNLFIFIFALMGFLSVVRTV